MYIRGAWQKRCENLSEEVRVDSREELMWFRKVVNQCLVIATPRLHTTTSSLEKKRKHENYEFIVSMKATLAAHHTTSWRFFLTFLRELGRRSDARGVTKKFQSCDKNSTLSRSRNKVLLFRGARVSIGFFKSSHGRIITLLLLFLLGSFSERPRMTNFPRFQVDWSEAVIVLSTS